jgi:DNA-binding NarL/FixJ family response regulator
MSGGTTPAAAAKPAARVLVVDDHALLAQSLAVALRAEGVEVTPAPTVELAAVLALAAELAPDLVLLDVDLGLPAGVTGVAYVEPLVAAGTRVALLTGSSDRTALAAALQAGALGWIHKATELGALAAATMRAVVGESLISADERRELLAELLAAQRVAAERARPLESLTSRERVILGHLMAGRRAEDVAAAEYVSLPTVRSQIRGVLTKLGVDSQLAAVARAREAGFDSSR